VAFDGIGLVYASPEKTKGSIGGDALIGATKGMQRESSRGPVSIDPAIRDIVRNISIRKVQRREASFTTSSSKPSQRSKTLRTDMWESMIDVHAATVGIFLLPLELLLARECFKQNMSSAVELRAAEDQANRDVVRFQEEGDRAPVVTDGKFRREN
jgi:hypothetical protein